MNLDINELYHQTIPDKEKRYNIDDPESTFGDNTSEDSQRKEKCQTDVTRLLKNSMKTSGIPEENSKGLRNDVYFKNLKRENEEARNRSLQNDSLSSSNQRPDEKSKSRNQEILTEIYILSSEGLAGITLDTEIYIQYTKKGTMNLHFISNHLWRNTDSHDEEKNERNPSSEKTIKRSGENHT